ncbi:MAG: hypothetical protein E7393_07225 [Ruminococcaceae bacterium]|nr:hypothetical protein [Oscillospiraceae bacterium]
MSEYIVKYGDKWWHFFIKPFYGLCFRKKEGSRFSNFEVLLSDACDDFCVLSVENQIHLVCQDKNGSILYLVMQDEMWRKTVLLESKSGTVYPKHFTLISIGGFINLFYIIMYKEKYMLVHQIITMEDRPPTVVDRIENTIPPFLVAAHTGTDISILYENESGTVGTRLYRWSRKTFAGFIPVNPSAKCFVRAFRHELGGRVRYAGFLTVEGIQNLVYFEKNEAGEYTEPTTVYLDCSKEAAPVFCQDGERLYLVWQEAGGIMSSYSINDGKKWSKPIRYMIPAGAETVLYGISENGETRYVYGYAKEQELVLYATPDLSDTIARHEQREFRPEGYDVVEFATEQGGKLEEPPMQTINPFITQIKEELVKFKEQFIHLHMEIADLREKIEQVVEQQTIAGGEKVNIIPDTVPLAEEDAIDAVLLKNASVGIQNKEN